MRTRAALAIVALLALTTGCEWWRPRTETRTFRVEHLAPWEVEQLLTPYVFTDRSTDPGAMSVTGTGGAVTVRETADNLDKIARVLEDFDVAAPDMRLRFQLVRANGAPEPPDPAIAEVVEELRGIFRFQGYRYMGEAMVTAGDGDVTQAFPGLPYRITARVRPQQRGVVRLEELRLWEGDGPPVLTTSVTLPAGQTLVLGSAPSGDSGGAVILTVQAEAPGGR